MKLNLFKVLFIVSLLGIGIYIWNERQNLKKEVCTLRNNQKAFIAENSSLKDESRAFKFTVEQLNYYNDSILQKMNDVRKELKIKDFNNTKVFQAVNVIVVQFDIYSEVKIYVDKYNFIYSESKYG